MSSSTSQASLDSGADSETLPTPVPAPAEPDDGTQIPEATPIPTATPRATATPSPTATPLATATPVATARPAAGVVKLIIDTDIASDCDDAGSIAMANAMADNGEVELLAMMVSTGGDYGAPALDAMNTFYGRPNIPIGTLKDTTFWVGGGLNEPTSSANFEKYNRYLAENFPNDLKTGKNAPDATALYRKILAEQPDQSVVINTLGALINIDKLLNSRADAYSTLNGVELVRKKVKLLVVAGGKNPTGSSSNFSKGNAEKYTKPAIDNWPGRIVFVGNEVGGGIDTGFQKSPLSAEENPAAMAYKIYFNSVTRQRPSWDQAATLYAVRGLGKLYALEDNGHQTVNAAGTNLWSYAASNQDHAYVIRLPDTKDALDEVIEALMTQLPKSRTK